MRRIPTYHYVALIALLILGATASLAANVVWHQDWVFQAPPTLNWQNDTGPYDFPSRQGATIAFAPDGGVLVGATAPAELNYQALLLDAAGGLRWVANLDGYRGGYDQYTRKLIADSDGSAFISIYRSSPPEILMRVAADGSLLWSRELGSRWIAKSGSGRLAVADSKGITLLDTSNGNVVWQRVFNTNLSSNAGGIVIGADTAIYASFPLGTGNVNTGFRVVKLDAAGNILWDVASNAADKASVIGQDGSQLYVQTTTDLRALRIADGSIAWSTPTTSQDRVLLSADSAAEPIVVGAGSIRRHAASSGSELWNQPLSGVAAADSIAGAILAMTDAGLVKLDPGSGAISWTTAMPATDALGGDLDWLSFGGLLGNRLLAVARSNSQIDAASAPLVQAIDFASGSLLASAALPSVAQGIEGSTLVDGDEVLTYGLAKGTNSQDLRLRLVDANSGVLQWETTHAIEWGAFGYKKHWPAYAALGPDSIAVATTWIPRYGTWGPTGALEIDLFDRSTGNLRWSKPVQENLQGLTHAFEPQFDATGNVFIRFGTTFPCGPAPTDRCGRQILYKLSAADGSLLWRFENPVETSATYYAFPSDFEVFGADAVADGYVSNPSGKLVRLSGADGSILWTSEPFPGSTSQPAIYRLDDQSIVSTDSGNRAKIDVATGLTVWSVPVVPLGCQIPCYPNVSMLLPDGDRLSVGEGDRAPLVTREHNDGGGAVDIWRPEPIEPELISRLLWVGSTPAGTTKVTLTRRNLGSAGTIRFVANFDLGTGALLGQQAVGADGADASANMKTPYLRGLPGELVSIFATRSVSSIEPTTSGAELLDTTVTAVGDLTITVTSSQAHVVPGGLLDFHLQVAYSGDQPISGVTLAAAMPWQGGIQSLACALFSGSNCSSDKRSGNVRASFDLNPGGTVDITGQIKVLDGDEKTKIYAYVYGPSGLSETNTINNFARVPAIQSLFYGGFDE